jgi:RNA polymerase sigma factor (sigma-70 family)
MPVPAAAMNMRPERTAFVDDVAALFHAHYESLYRYLDRLVGDADLASDLAQETFVRLYQRGSIPDEPRGWLLAVAMNLLRDHSRRAKRRGALIAKHASAALLSAQSEQADAALLSNEASARVRVALESLSPRDRQLLLLRQEGYSYREMANAIGVAEASIGTTLVRAMRAFEAALERATPRAGHSR